MTSRKWPEVSPFSQSLFRVRLQEKNWARLIQKIYGVDPLCPKCQGRMKIVAFIEAEEVTEKILKHLELENEVIFIESRIPEEVRDPLIRAGCQFTVKKDFYFYFGGAQGVMIDPKTGKLHEGADPRREGSILGF